MLKEVFVLRMTLDFKPVIRRAGLVISAHSQTLHHGGHRCDLYEVTVSAESAVNGSKPLILPVIIRTNYGHTQGSGSCGL